MKEKKKRIIIKTILCLIYIAIMGILFICSFRLYQEKEEIRSIKEIESIEEYTYITIDKMSETFALKEETNLGFHFVLDKDNLYVIAINENEISTYQPIIDYTYEKTTKKPDSIKVFGYLAEMKDHTKLLALNNVDNFIENKEITLSDNYLDTTKEKHEEFNIILFGSVFLLFLVVVLLILTIIDKDKIVDTFLEDEKEEV